MKLITRDTDYAVRALCFMARQKKKVVCVPELTAALKIPRPFLRKILQKLNKKGILRSSRGLGGGFRLALPADKIYLADLIVTFQGPLSLNECIFSRKSGIPQNAGKKKICPARNNCALRARISAIEKQVISELKSITLGSLLKEGVSDGKKKNHQD